MLLRIPPSLQSLTSPNVDSSRSSVKEDSQLNQSSSRPDSSPDKLKKKSRPLVVFVFLLPEHFEHNKILKNHVCLSYRSSQLIYADNNAVQKFRMLGTRLCSGSRLLVNRVSVSLVCSRQGYICAVFRACLYGFVVVRH